MSFFSLQIKGFGGGIVQRETVPGVVYCDPKRLILGTCEGPPPTAEVEKRSVLGGVSADLGYNFLPHLNDTKNWRLKILAGAGLFTNEIFIGRGGVGLDSVSQNLSLQLQFGYDPFQESTSQILGVEWHTLDDHLSFGLSGIRMAGDLGALFSVGFHTGL